MSATPEVRTRRGWRRLGDGTIPAVLETDTIEVRGLAPGRTVRIGMSDLITNESGEASLRPGTDEHLSGHVGIIEVAAGGALVGEIELVAHKMSEAAYRQLRAELHRVWTDLIFADGAASSVQAGPPSARELWRRIDRPMMQILDQPNTVVEVGIEPRRLDRVRRLRELTPAVVRAGQRDRPALTRTLRRTTDTPENQLCTATLRLLRNHALRDPTALDVVSNIDRLLHHPTLPTTTRPLRRVTWGMRSDRRYRQVLAVHLILNRPELEATEGPGELRLGVPALSRLYEYWVFLQVLREAERLYGRPAGLGFGQLAVPVRGNRWRLEIERGTTVTFPGPVHVAFEPNITARGDGWMGLEYVPHPDPARQQLMATPDVAVLAFTAGRAAPALTIIDAKYVGRSFVELEAARVHDKYARMRLDGTPVVDNVLVAHPHAGFAHQWAGYGHLALTPDQPPARLPLPPPRPVEANPAAAQRTSRVAERPPEPGESNGATGAPPFVVADQYWMRHALAGRRIDLEAMRPVIARGRTVQQFDLAMPRIGQLEPFARAAESCGWKVQWLDSPERGSQISAIIDLIRAHLPHDVIVVSGDPELLARLPAGSIETFHDLDQVPGL